MTEDVNFQQNYNGRNEKFQIFNMSNYKVSQNLMVNKKRKEKKRKKKKLNEQESDSHAFNETCMLNGSAITTATKNEI